jgi:serine protease
MFYNKKLYKQTDNSLFLLKTFLYYSITFLINFQRIMMIILNKKFRLIQVCILILSTGSFAGTGEIIKKGNTIYLSNQIVIKLKDFPNVQTNGNAVLSKSLQNFFEKIQSNKIESVFPSKVNERSTSLGKILIVSYEGEVDPLYLSSKLKKSDDIEWAEPRYLYELCFDPDDPSFNTQWNLSKILASQAWDISQGDTSVIIGIVDTGVDWDHPDLNGNIWINRDEIPGNGVDDDLNGFIDDIRGWDFGGLTGTPDNNPMEDRPDHGTHVAGIAAAVTNNGIGISSIGFNSKIMAIKTSQDNIRNNQGQALIAFGYEGIIYAADNGAKVINCSWGGGGYSIFSQEVIDYAASKGALVVAAAGNSGDNSSHFPSGYDKVLSVASSTDTDLKSGFSTYGPTVDVSAPGSGIYSTWQDNTYISIGGTSMASPLTAGLAALVWTQLPSYTPLQIAEQIRVNSDNIDGLNQSYAQLIGKGRINALNALTNTNSISVRAVEIEFSDEAPGGNGDGIFTAGETLSISVRFINFLNPTSSLSVSLQSKNAYSNIINGNFNGGSRVMLEEFNNYSSKFTFSLSESLPANAQLDFILAFQDGNYEDYQWIRTIGNPTYATQAGNDISLTITSKGTLGFNDYPDNLQGDGFRYLNSSNHLFEGALILATSSAQVSDAARGSSGNDQNADFSVVQPFILDIPGTIADYQGTAVFNDDGAGGGKIGVTTKLESFSFADIPHNNYIILKYSFTNNTASTINSLHAGLFFDWDLIDGSGADDVTAYDLTNNLSYTNNTSPSGPDVWITTAAITSGDFSFWAIKNDGGDGGFQIYDGFTDSEKWQALSGGIGKSSAGPGDVSHVVGGGPFNLTAGETKDLGFVIGAGSNLAELQTIVENARSRYPFLVVNVEDEENNLPEVFNLSQNFPNPFNPSTSIEFSMPQESFVSLKVYNVVGEEVSHLVNEKKSAGIYRINFDASSIGGGLTSGVYFYRLEAVPIGSKSGNFVSTKKLVFIK